jgi:hypothetical protein
LQGGLYHFHVEIFTIDNDRTLFVPPQGIHTSDEEHTTEYCNGWNNGYISAWNVKYAKYATQ